MHKRGGPTMPRSPLGRAREKAARAPVPYALLLSQNSLSSYIIFLLPAHYRGQAGVARATN